MSDERFTAFPPPGASRAFLWTTSRRIVTAVGFVVAASVVAWLLTGVAPGGVVLAVWTLMAAGGGYVSLQPINGRTVDVWGPQWVRWLLAGGAGAHVSVRPDGGWLVDRARVSVTKVPGQPPPTAAGIELLDVEVDGRRFGVVADRKADTFTVVAEVAGARFALTSPDTRARLLDTWTAALNELALEGKALRRGAWITASIPDDGDRLVDDMAQAARFDTIEGRNLGELVDQAATRTVTHRTWLALTIDPAGIPPRRLQSAPTWDARVAAWAADVMGRAHVALAPSGLTVVDGLLTAGKVAALIRGMYDPAARRRWADWAHDRRDTDGDPASVWPQAVEERHDWYRTDGGLHACFHVERLDGRPQPPHLMTTLDLAVTWAHVIGVVWEPIPPEVSEAAVRRETTDADAADDLEARKGFRQTVAARRQRDATKEREERLARGTPECWMSAYVCVTVPPDTDGGAGLVWDARDDTVRAGSRRGLLLRPCDLQHGKVHTALLPAGRGIGRRR